MRIPQEQERKVYLGTKCSGGKQRCIDTKETEHPERSFSVNRSPGQELGEKNNGDNWTRQDKNLTWLQTKPPAL